MFGAGMDGAANAVFCDTHWLNAHLPLHYYHYRSMVKEPIGFLYVTF